MANATLLEIANVERTVEIRGKSVAVFGVSATSIAGLMVRFPEIGKMLSGGSPDMSALGTMAPAALGAFIAAGCGKPGDEGIEHVAATLSVGEQLDLIDEIVRLTFPRGIGPFMERLEALGLLAQEGIQHRQASRNPSKSSSASATETQ